MGDDDLNRPLGLDPPRRARSHRGVLLAVLGGGAAAALAAALVTADPRGGEPFVVAALPPASSRLSPQAAQVADPTHDPAPVPSAPVSAAPAPAARIENGVSVFRAGQAQTGSGPLVIKVQQALGLNEVAPVDRRLIEATRYGPLPRIGADGTRPSDVYARPPVLSGAIGLGTPRIAIVVTGLGSDRALTDDAIGRMPAAVSLAFSPYGETLDAFAERAKAAGHEVLLQLAVAPDREEGRPAAHALRAGAAPVAMLDDLRWLMSRMSGYVGVSNFHGGLLATDQAAMTTMLQEIGGRGLLYAEDGRAAAPLAGLPGVPPVAKADLVLEADADAGAVRAVTVKVEAIARAKGAAVAAVGASPGSLAALATFVGTLGAKGLALVPVSSLAGSAAPVVARTP